MRYEYLVFEIDETPKGLMVRLSPDEEKPIESLELFLNSYGADGWELVESSLLEWRQEEMTKYWQISTYRLIFKRPGLKQ